ncbi:MAG: alpha/beta hydrolase fold domain-containing protein, partial [Deltaproteobacteria bacterium]|nr:alpha/beta hydrolase fold domain-containing protein [Deltaproteobacteria bacterium]
MLRFVLVILLWSVLAPLLGTIHFLSRARSPHWSWPYHLFALFMQRVTPAAVALPPRRLRNLMERAGALFVRLIAGRPRRVEVGGVPCAWFGRRDEGPVVIYLHGGGYAVGSPNTHGHPLALLARMTRTRLLAIDYRLAPEHPHPHALEDALAAYRALLDTGVSA